MRLQRCFQIAARVWFVLTRGGEPSSIPSHHAVHYTGTLKDGGAEFDSSVAKNRPFQFTLGVGQVIKGWDEGVLGLKVGTKAILDITSDFGYGERGA